MDERTCSIDGCDRVVCARGICRSCYRYLYSTGAHQGYPKIERLVTSCSVEGCNRPHAARGWCLMHYKRARKRGFTLDPKYCETCGSELTAVRVDARFCSKECTFQAYYAEHRERLIAYQRQHYKAHRAQIVTAQAQYVKRNRKLYQKIKREYYERNLELVRSRTKEWAAKNPERNRLNRQKVNAKRRGAIGNGYIAERDWIKLVRRHQGVCPYCSGEAPDPHMDHVVPISRGGKHTIGNVLPVCGQCNLSKNASLLSEWRFRRTRKGLI